MKVYLIILMFVSLSFAKKNLLGKETKKATQVNQVQSDNDICDFASGQEIGNQIIEKVNEYRKSHNIETTLFHDDILANKVYKLVINLIKNPDMFYSHDNFDVRSTSDQDYMYYGESFAKLYEYENPANQAYTEWLSNNQIETNILREFDEGEAFCCESGVGWYCAITLAKYNTKYK